MSIAVICCVENCTKHIVGRNLCTKHYYHWRKNNPDKIKHFRKKREIHGLENSAEYSTWAGIIKRTTVKTSADYVNYGARGIKVCDRWTLSFINFYQDMGQKPSSNHSIERKDNNGNYEPSNCRWATRDVQAINKRLAKNNKSGIAGVRFNKNRNRWVADIRLNKKLIFLGYFVDKDNAIKARLAAQEKYFNPRLLS